MDWRARFRAPLLESFQLAAGAPDRGLVVSSLDGETTQLYAADLTTGGLTALTDEPHGVGEGWLDPTGSHVHYLADPDGTELGHLVRVPFSVASTSRGAVDLTPDMEPYTLRGVGFAADGTMAFNPINRDGFGLHVLDPTPRMLRRDSYETWGALLSARGDLAACWSTARARGSRLYTLLAVSVETGEVVGELDDGRAASVVGVRFAPGYADGRLLATTTTSGWVRPVLWDPLTGDRRDLNVSSVEGDVQALDWRGDRVLLCAVTGAQRLLEYDLATDTLTALDHPPGTYFDSYYGGFEYAPTGEIVGLRRVATEPPSVVSLSGAVLLSAPGPQPPPGQPWRSVTFPSSDGVPVQAWVATPPGDGPWPTILNVHGGPHMAQHEEYSPWAQAFLDHGYAWVSVNYRGSTTFGRDFTEKIWGNRGHWELEDMVAGRAWAVDNGIARPDSVIVHGGSYGGYLTLFALGRRPDLWCGGLALVAIGDTVANYEESSDALRAAQRAWMRSTPSERPEAWAASSPITYAADVAAPVLIIQGRNDTRTTPGQLEKYERRMRELGKDITVDWYEGGHGSIGPALWIDFIEKMLTFADTLHPRSA